MSSADRNLVPPDGEALDITDEVLRSCGNLSERNVCELIRASAKKSCLLDPFPTNVVCDSLNVLLPVITNMVNASLSTGHFPDNWKEAIINPLFKKGTIDFAYKNLRPVSNLQFVSKITERAANYTPMSAYRKSHSTETALVKIVNDILLDMNRQHVSLLVLLDLSAAFDTVHHIILLRRLETSFGVTGDALKWIASYLSARSQRIMINGILSDLICHLEFLKGHASDHFCSLLMRESCSRLSKTICLMRMRTLTTLSFICRSSQTVQWIRRKQEVLWKDVSGQ